MACQHSIGTNGGCQYCCQYDSTGTIRSLEIINYPLTAGARVPQLTAFAALINGINFDTIALTPTAQIGINPGEHWQLDYSTGQWSHTGGVANSPFNSSVEIDMQYLGYLEYGAPGTLTTISGLRTRVNATVLSCWSLLEEVEYPTGPNAPFIDYECFGSSDRDPAILDFGITPLMYSHADDTYPSIDATVWWWVNSPYTNYTATNCPPPPNVSP